MKTQLYQFQNKAIRFVKRVTAGLFPLSLVLLFVVMMPTQGLMAQNRVVYGEISVFENLKLQNVLVESKKTGAKVLSDSTGSFIIISAPRDVLYFSNKAFETRKVRVKPKTDSVFVNLEIKGSNATETLMSIGYGYTTHSKNSFAHNNLTSDEVNFCNYNNIYELIKGRFPGVTVSSANNAPGAEQDITIRGKGTINLETTPLFIVDGLHVSTLSYINPCDVKSIDVLKDGSASIYGSRGANGVILIETR